MLQQEDTFGLICPEPTMLMVSQVMQGATTVPSNAPTTTLVPLMRL